MTTQNPLKIAIIANKTWECEPLLNVLLSRDGRSPALGGATFLRGYDPAEKKELDPATGNPVSFPLPPEADGLPVRGALPIRPRLTFSISNKIVQDDKSVITTTCEVELWCIEDWMRSARRKPGAADPVRLSSSSSYEKYTFALPQIRKKMFNGTPPHILIGFGTAGIPSPESLNGCVTVGTQVYVHDPWSNATDSEKAVQIDKYGPLLHEEIKGKLDERIDTEKLSDTFFQDVSPELRFSAEARFLKIPIAPTDVPRIMAGTGYASLGTINISNYDDYFWADEATLSKFETQIKRREIGSMETTHGLIRLTWPETAFLFVSGLTDRVPMFNAEVTPRIYAQNFVAAHNAGVTVSFLLPEIFRLHQLNKLLK